MIEQDARSESERRGKSVRRLELNARNYRAEADLLFRSGSYALAGIYAFAADQAEQHARHLKLRFRHEPGFRRGYAG